MTRCQGIIRVVVVVDVAVLVVIIVVVVVVFLILLTHEGSHGEVYRDFQPSLTSSAGGAKV